MGASEIAAATPATRDRYVDLLRVASLGTVIAGHWLMAAVSTGGMGNLLAIVPPLQVLTWALQVMPVFFFVGGFSHALSHRSLARTADGPVYAAFLRARLRRLLRPTLVFVAVWTAAALTAQLLGAGGGKLSGALALVAYGPYPLSMVGMPGEKVSNMAPPTLALLAHALWLVGAVELLRAPAAAWLARPRVWRAVVSANGVAMTAFLWHLTAMLAVYAAQLGLGIALPEPAGAAWWAQVPVRFLAAAALTCVLVAVFRRFEAPGPRAPAADRSQDPAPAPAAGSGPRAAAGTVLCLLGVLGLSVTGLGGLLDGHSATLIALPVTAPAAIAMALGGWLLVERSGTSRRVRLRG